MSIKLIKILFITVLFVMSFSATTDQKNIHTEYVYTVTQGLDGAPLMGRVVDAEFDGDQHLYLLDDGNKMIHQFNSEGHFLRSFGREGRGPGEFTAVGKSLFFDELSSEICAIDYPCARVICFSTFEENQHSSKLLQSTSAVRINGLVIFNSKYLLLGSHQDANSFIHEIDDQGRTIQSFGDFIDFSGFIHNYSGKM